MGTRAERRELLEDERPLTFAVLVENRMILLREEEER